MKNSSDRLHKSIIHCYVKEFENLGVKRDIFLHEKDILDIICQRAWITCDHDLPLKKISCECLTFRD